MPHIKLDEMLKQTIECVSNGNLNDQPFGTNLNIGARKYFPNNIANGYREYVSLSPNLFVTLNNFTPTEDLQFKLAGEDSFIAHFQLSGQSYSQFTVNQSLEITGAKCVMAYHPSGIGETEFFPAGINEQSITISCGVDLFKDYFQGDSDSISRYLRQLVFGQTQKLVLETMPIMPRMCDIVKQLINLESEGQLRRLHYEALSMEILCELFSYWSERETHRKYIELSGKDVKRIHEVHDLLRDSFPATPSIADISRQVGLNRNKLCYGFKAVFHQTIGEYCQLQRMQYAAELLQKSNETVNNISYKIGYENVASFSTAFKKHYQISPSEYRRSV